MEDLSSRGLTRRGFVAAGGVLAGTFGLPLAHAAGFPERPIRLVVPYPAGGSTDLVARLVARQLGEAIKGNVVVDNKAGAAGALGASDVARAAADGYTLLANIVTSAVIMPITQGRQLSYDPVGAFQAVALVCKLPNVLVIRKDIPARTFGEFAAWARAHPDQANYGTGGTGSVMHLSGELLQRDGRFGMVHVPYKGGAAALQDLMGGSLAAVLDNITGVMGAIRAGSVRAIGVSTEQRSAALPDVPTFAEAGVPGFANSSWFGVFTRAGTPPAVLARLERGVLDGCAQPEALARLRELGAVPEPMGASAMEAFWKAEFTYWRKAVATAGLTLN